MLKADAAATMRHIIAGFRIIVVAVTPGTHPGGAIANLRIHIGIEKPERNINSLDLIDVVLILKNLRQQPLTGQVLHQSRLCRLFIQLERNDKIRLESARELAHHHHGIAAKRTSCSCRVGVADDLASAGLAHIGAQAIGFSLLPVSSGSGFPFHIVIFFALQLGVVACQRLHFKLRVAKRTLHLLEGAVKGYCAAAAGAFIFLQGLHEKISSLKKFTH